MASCSSISGEVTQQHYLVSSPGDPDLTGRIPRETTHLLETEITQDQSITHHSRFKVPV